MVSLEEEDFRRFGVYKMSAGDEELRRWRIREMGISGDGSLRDGECSRWEVLDIKS